MVNFVVVVLGVVAANLATAAPWIALGFAALMLINGVFFHIVPFVVTRFRFSPGLFTAVLLLLPIGAACYRAADRAGVISFATVVGSVALGALLMAMPIVLLRARGPSLFPASLKTAIRGWPRQARP